jgi:hypothetical protein
MVRKNPQKGNKNYNSERDFAPIFTFLCVRNRIIMFMLKKSEKKLTESITHVRISVYHDF